VGQFKINNKSFVPSAFRRILDINSYALEWAYLANLFVDLSACVHKSISHSSGWQSVFTRVIALFPLLAEGFRHPSFFFFQNALCIGESPSSREITPANRGASRSATQLV